MIKTGIIVAVDFDGTCVTHEFPKVGKELPYCVETLKKIVAHGGRLILWTMRSNHIAPPIIPAGPDNCVNPIIACDMDNYLDHAINWFYERGIPLWGIQENPEQKTWTTSPKAYAHIYIDDAADLGTYTMEDANLSERRFVDWAIVDALLFPEEF